MEGEGKQTPQGLFEGDRMFDERVARVRQSRIAGILLKLGCKNTRRADLTTNLEEGQIDGVTIQSL